MINRFLFALRSYRLNEGKELEGKRFVVLCFAVEICCFLQQKNFKYLRS